MQLGPDAALTAATAAGASAGGDRVRRIGANKQPPAPVLPPSTSPSGGRFSGRVLPLLIGGIALVVIIAGLIVITNTGGGDDNSARSATPTPARPVPVCTSSRQTPVPFNAAKVTVAVLNGTAQSGLAGDVGTKLVGEGYKKGNITNAASQTEGLTFVYYTPGAAAKANKVAAQHVATALSLSPTRVRRRWPAACSRPARSALPERPWAPAHANVIVSVGQDRVNLATGG